MKQFLELKKEQKLSMKQSLNLSQQMKLSINILAMSIEKLNDFVLEEVEENPNVELKFFIRDKNFYRNEDISELDNISQDKNFYEELEEQINFLKLDKKMRESCIFIVNNLNEKGYLLLSKRELLRELKVDENYLTKILEVIHSLEPYGVGAFSLEDCLKIQLKQKNIFDEKLDRLIDKYLILIAEQKFELIKEKLNINEEQMRLYISEIKKLNPIPSRGYNTGKLRRVIPEIIVKKVEDKYKCELNEKVIPQLSIKNENEIDKNFYKRVNDIILAIEKRNATLLKISEFITEKQKIFFETLGKEATTLKIIDIAQELNLSISTVSRTIKEKYILTDFGVVALRKIICMSSEAIKEKEYIEKYIENENREKPYSDQELTELLRKDGFKIARRTVSKYRKELGYKSSSSRKV
ncbi:MAG: RNA polymerase factor sigma-54 [Fusobacterium gastrosuis]|uniref:RNA polymerase factor sigma-54 n=1 Tax=Fusobacterium gastrosuis TaxID=1755100 RepID=UPI002A905001|nr:RNA polymerase factor sigma-54 [Fusobacterium gastrosuis]